MATATLKRAKVGRQFKAAPGAKFNNEQAAQYGTFLEDRVGLGRRNVAPEEIVVAARPKRSPIHREFTWDDTEAAEMWRVQEARQLVNHVLIVTTHQDGAESSSRAFHSVIERDSDDEPGTRGYTSEHRVWSKPELADQVITRARRELAGWRDRYQQYAFLSTWVHTIDDLLEEETAA